MRPCKPEQQLQLRGISHAGLMIGQGVRRGSEVDLARQGEIVVDENALPRNLHVVTDDDAIAFVKMMG